MHEVKNISKATQVFQQTNGRRVSLAPEKSSGPVELSQRTVERLRRGESLRVVEVHESRAPVETEQAPAPAEVQSSVETEQVRDPGTSERTFAASGIINRYQSRKITFAEFSAEAKEFLGNKWPGGTPRKSVVLELLRAE